MQCSSVQKIIDKSFFRYKSKKKTPRSKDEDTIHAWEKEAIGIETQRHPISKDVLTFVSS